MLPCFASVLAAEKAASLASGEDDFEMRGVEADDLAAQRGRAFAIEVAGEIERAPRLPAVAGEEQSVLTATARGAQQNQRIFAEGLV